MQRKGSHNVTTARQLLATTPGERVFHEGRIVHLEKSICYKIPITTTLRLSSSLKYATRPTTCRASSYTINTTTTALLPCSTNTNDRRQHYSQQPPASPQSPRTSPSSKAPFKHPPENIERVSGLTAAQFQAEYYDKQQPVVITDALKNWPALHRWKDKNHLKNACPEEVVPVSIWLDVTFN